MQKFEMYLFLIIFGLIISSGYQVMKELPSVQPNVKSIIQSVQ